jgi:hypothetical protein
VKLGPGDGNPSVRMRYRVAIHAMTKGVVMNRRRFVQSSLARRTSRDAACRKILRNCAGALPAQGVLLISESVLHPDFSDSNFTNVKDLIMLVASERARESVPSTSIGLFSTRRASMWSISFGWRHHGISSWQRSDSFQKRGHCGKPTAIRGFTPSRPTHSDLPCLYRIQAAARRSTVGARR